MIQANQVQLIGTVMEGTIKKVALSNGGTLITFTLMTKELWHLRNQETSEHIELHKLTLRDVGNYRMATRYGSLLKDNMKILVTGHLRYKVFRDGSNNKTDRITEIDVDGFEVLGMDLQSRELFSGFKAKSSAPQADAASVMPSPELAPEPASEIMPYGQAAVVNNPYMQPQA